MKWATPLGLLVLAGCLAPMAPTPSAPSAPSALDLANLPFLAIDHDHTDPTIHQGAAHGLAVTAHLPMAEELATGYLGEMDIMGDLLASATEQNPGGVTLVDIADPDHPEVVSHIALDDAVVADVKLSPDAKTLFVATSSWLLLGGEVARLDSGPGAVPTLARAFGVVVYDVSDPAHPSETANVPVGRDGVHMLDLHVIRGTTYLFATTPFYSPATLATQFLPVGSPDNSIVILRWEGGLLVPVSSYDAPEKKGYDFAHDITVVDDDGRVLLLSAYAVLGAGIADVTDPANPKHLGSFLLADAGITDSDVHTVMMEHVGDRRILVTSPELANDGELLTVDATDLAHPTLIGRWALPDTKDRIGSEWSPHNVELLDGKAYLAHYHAGAWVLDVGSDATLAQPKVLAYFAPADLDHPPAQNFLYGGQAPSTWELIPAKGRVFVSDMGTGLYVLKPAWMVAQEPPYGTRTSPAGD